ncbi:hypothetical protein AMATHDRAFT_50494 [Amanita thiersii Skay4041]|uniref:Uncharacterized protein n=1 Tax=Amanita thiersii Skay4041 TaxID=703135 RepID=A0A2A9NHN9_9AGAR|nr:hypothetical protein AMATHDRAFT_50494 [Amanita thiersii Skay4041]
MFSANLRDVASTEPGYARVILLEQIHLSSGLVGKGTIVFRVKQDGTTGKWDIIVKISSQSVEQFPERVYLRYAKEGLTESCSSFVQSLLVLIGWTPGSRLSDGPRGRPSGPGKVERKSTSDRVLQILAFPYYNHVYELTKEEDFKKVIRDCVNCRFSIVTFFILYSEVWDTIIRFS